MWNDECLKDFQCLKEKLVVASIIIAIDWSKQFNVMYDANRVVLGIIFKKHKEKHFLLINYTSKESNRALKNYTPIEKEQFSIIYAFERFRAYLLGTKVIFLMNHLDT